MAAQLTVVVPTDTPPPPRRRVQAIEVSDWYERRLTLHRRLSYVTIPLFVMQWTAGQQVWEKGDAAPDWALTTHRIGATSLATVFTANTVTGVWNLWDSRGVEQGRMRRIMHTTSMLVAGAGFTYAGVHLSEKAETDFEARRMHRRVALTSMGITVTSSIIMWVFNK